ncbi:MAG: HAMP domain-containing protein [Chloroflexi bacterium]|nr:HAMP domain-containing protein [Chloroflexota bacterium]
MRALLASLRLRLIVLVVLAAVPAFGLVFYSGLEQRRAAATNAQTDALRLARLASSEQQQLIKDTRQLLVLLSRLPQVRDGDPTACNALLGQIKPSYTQYTNLAVLSADGYIRCSALPADGAAAATDRRFFRRAVETRDFAVGDYAIGRLSGKATLQTGYPVLDENGNVEAVVHAGIDLTWLSRFAEAAHLPEGSRLSVNDKTGRILARYPNPQDWVGRPSPGGLIAQALRTGQHEGVGEGTGTEGVPRLFAYTPLGGFGQDHEVYISVAIPTSLAYAEADWILQRNLTGLGVVVLLALVAAWFGSDLFILRRLRVLVTASRRLAAGDLTARTGLGSGHSELNELARAFDDLAGSLQEQHLDRLRYDEERTRLLEAIERERNTLAGIMASMSQGLMLADPSGNGRYCNYRAASLMGLHPDSVLNAPVEDCFDRLREYAVDADNVLPAWRRALDLLSERPSFELGLAGPPRRDLLFDLFPVAESREAEPGVGILVREVTAERDLERTKDELVSVVSHELRTPLAALVGFAELLLTRDLERLERKECLAIMVQEGQRLTALINDLLDLQQMGAAGQQLALEPTDLREVIVSATAVAGLEEQHILTLDLPAEIPPVRGDAPRLQQVFGNLLANARKYSPAGGEIRVSAQLAGGVVEVVVADQGLGIPLESLPRLFDKFYRVDNSDRRTIKGTGLGLAICRKIVDGHGGRIWAES